MIKVITTKIKMNYNQGQRKANNTYKSGHGGKKKVLYLDYAQSKSYDYQGNYYWIKEADLLYDKAKGFINKLYIDKEYKFLVYEGKTGTRSVLAITNIENDFKYKKIDIKPGQTREELRNQNICGNCYVGYYQVEIIKGVM